MAGEIWKVYSSGDFAPIVNKGENAVVYGKWRGVLVPLVRKDDRNILPYLAVHAGGLQVAGERLPGEIYFASRKLDGDRTGDINTAIARMHVSDGRNWDAILQELNYKDSAETIGEKVTSDMVAYPLPRTQLPEEVGSFTAHVEKHMEIVRRDQFRDWSWGTEAYVTARAFVALVSFPCCAEKCKVSFTPKVAFKVSVNGTPIEVPAFTLDDIGVYLLRTKNVPVYDNTLPDTLSLDATETRRQIAPELPVKTQEVEITASELTESVAASRCVVAVFDYKKIVLDIIAKIKPLQAYNGGWESSETYTVDIAGTLFFDNIRPVP